MFASYRTRPRGVLRSHTYAGDLSHEMEQLLSSFAPEHRRSALRDEGDFLSLVMAMPGVRDEDLEITATPDELRIRAERKPLQREGYEGRRRERTPVKFAQELRLPCRVEADSIRATLKDGVLRIELPKTGEEARRTIQINKN